MKNKLLQVISIPKDVKKHTVMEITSKDVGYFTHSFFKYPCKFIPQVPRWAIEKYTKENDLVLDCFAGSGTTLVEAVLMNRNGLGVDFDKLSQLLCLTKTKILSTKEIFLIREKLDALFIKNNKTKFTLPDIHNIEHWFSKETINELCILKNNIDKETNKNINKFLLVCFASIIKKVSNADENSPKPYVSSRFLKKKYLVKDIFIKSVNNYLDSFDKYKDYKLGNAKIISEDARSIKNIELKNKIDLAITSPPYINAFDYVRSLRLENAWLNYFGDSNILEIKKNQIGTESISAAIYNEKIIATGLNSLDSILKKIYLIDKKRAFVVHNYFKDMKENISTVLNLLKNNSHYIIVVGDSVIRDIKVPTHNILIEIAEQNGFQLENVFSYIIKNRYLRIPRADRGGFIKFDWIIDLKKN
ncbi:MAG: DNA methyltransferase [Bacteroidales bacterium]